MAQHGTPNDRLDHYVTVGADFVHAGDIAMGGGEMLKVGSFYRPVPIFESNRSDGSEIGRVAIVSDEGAAMGGQGAAPAPLQYFLAAIAF
jgi:hypothetical protein